MLETKIPIKENDAMGNNYVKKISVSAKRQMTIPKQFYDELQLGDEVVCQIIDGALLIKPVPQDLDFSEFILNDLIKEGYEAGEEMMKEFAYRKSQINATVQKMMEETRDYKTYASAEELFNALDEEDEDE